MTRMHDKRMTQERLPGSLWINRGRWAWRGTLPGESGRHNHAVRAMEGGEALPSSAPRALAEAAVRRMIRSAAAEHGAAGPLRRVRGEGWAGTSVADAAAAYAQVARRYYPTGSEARTQALYIGEVVRRHGARDVGELCAADLTEARDALVARGLSRSTINHAVNAWRAWARWMQDARLISGAQRVELEAVQRLRAGRSDAREPEPVRAACPCAVRAALAGAPPSLRAMALVQELAGMRPGEVCAMRWEEVERASPCWIYRPKNHKTAWRGMPRAVALGPRAQALLRPYERATGPVFSPAATELERRGRGRRAREDAERRPGEAWTPGAYSKAVLARVRAAVRAGTVPAALAWHPHMLRHTCATRVRAACGLEAARAVLGHSMRGGVTDVYSRAAMEQEALRLAVPAMAALG